MAIHSIVLNRFDIKTQRNGYNFMLTTTDGMEIIFTPDAIDELITDSKQYMKDMKELLGESFIASMYADIVDKSILASEDAKSIDEPLAKHDVVCLIPSCEEEIGKTYVIAFVHGDMADILEYPDGKNTMFNIPLSRLMRASSLVDANN